MNEIQIQNGLTLNNAVSRFISFIDRKDRTAQTYYCNIKQFEAYRRYKGITLPQRSDVIAFRDWLIAEHDAIELDDSNPQGWSYRLGADGKKMRIACKPSTVTGYLRAVCQFFRWLASEGIYPNIADNIHAPKVNNAEHKKSALSVEGLQKVKATILTDADTKIEKAETATKDREGRLQRADEQGKRLSAMVELASNAGLRCVELSRLNVGDLEVIDGVPYISIYGKGHDSADVRKPLADGVYAVIRDYLDSRTDSLTPSAPLFRATGNRNTTGRIASSTIGVMIKNSMKSAGYDSGRLTAHSLRHTCGTETMSLTGNLYETQKYLRHASPVTTELYLHCESQKKEQITANRLYNHLNGKEETLTGRDKLETILARLSDSQINKLAELAEVMAV